MIRMRRIGVLAAALSSMLMAGCGASGTARHAASVVDYLYPKGQPAPIDTGPAVLRLPIKVGIAFVPATNESQRDLTSIALPENDRLRLLEQVSERFRALPFVKSIQQIPSAYLMPQGGFDNLEQVQRMFGVDVVALVSYDQVQFTDSRNLSFTYWTIVGAYLIQAEKNDTRTLLDAAVFDVASRRLLFRAPGTSHVKGSSTPINLAEEMRESSGKGFELAAADLSKNLEAELDRFKARVKEAPADFRVETRAGASGSTGGGGGAGAADPLLLGLALAACAAAWASRRR